MPGHVFVEWAWDYLGLEVSWGLSFSIDLELPIADVLAGEGDVGGFHYFELGWGVDDADVDAGVTGDENALWLYIKIQRIWNHTRYLGSNITRIIQPKLMRTRLPQFSM